MSNEDKCVYCREYGNLPCEECDKKAKERQKEKVMSNTKFIKVDVSERLPKKEKWYHVIGEDGNVDLCPFRFNEFFATDTIGQREVKFWLEEVPDRESELIEMLKRMIEWYGKYEESPEPMHPDFIFCDDEKQETIIIEAKKLIQSVKQPKN